MSNFLSSNKKLYIKDRYIKHKKKPKNIVKNRGKSYIYIAKKEKDNFDIIYYYLNITYNDDNNDNKDSNKFTIKNVLINLIKIVLAFNFILHIFSSY